MVDGAEIREFWSHWGHDPNFTAEFQRFRIRVTEVLRLLWENFFRGEGRKALRERLEVISGTPHSVYDYFDRSGLSHLLEEAQTIFDVASAVQNFLWTVENVREDNFDYCCREIQRAFDLSPTIMIRLVRHGKTATLYPTGVRLLDEAIVESNLIWLARYPDVLRPFETALKLYMAKDASQYRSMLDSLRFALEQMLRAVLNNQKSLENQKEEFLRWLNSHGVHVRSERCITIFCSAVSRSTRTPP